VHLHQEHVSSSDEITKLLKSTQPMACQSAYDCY
jgi:hypothetical protein